MSKLKELAFATLFVALFISVCVGIIWLTVPNPEKKDDERTLGFEPNNTIALVGSNQKVVVVWYEFMKPWFESVGQHSRIISINGIGQGSYGRDTYFLIVFEDITSTEVEQEKGIY